MRLFYWIVFLTVTILLISCQPGDITPPPDPTPVVLKDTTIKDIAYGTNNSQKIDLGLPRSEERRVGKEC